MVSSLQLPMGSRCIKYLMFIFNLFFVLTGIILISIGATVRLVYNDYTHFLDDKFFSVPSLMIAVGAIIFFIAFFGCCGAVKENYCMVLTFSALMILIFILELSAGISGYVLRNDAVELIEHKMQQSMHRYHIDNDTALVWDELQEKFECCGARKPSDWTDPKAINLTDIPTSCCSHVVGQLGSSNCTINSENLFKEGCLSSFGHFAKTHAVQLGGAGLGIAFVQAIGIWFSIYLARAIKSNYETV